MIDYIKNIINSNFLNFPENDFNGLNQKLENISILVERVSNEQIVQDSLNKEIKDTNCYLKKSLKELHENIVSNTLSEEDFFFFSQLVEKNSKIIYENSSFFSYQETMKIYENLFNFYFKSFDKVLDFNEYCTINSSSEALFTIFSIILRYQKILKKNNSENNNKNKEKSNFSSNKTSDDSIFDFENPLRDSEDYDSMFKNSSPESGKHIKFDNFFNIIYLNLNELKETNLKEFEDLKNKSTKENNFIALEIRSLYNLCEELQKKIPKNNNEASGLKSEILKYKEEIEKLKIQISYNESLTLSKTNSNFYIQNLNLSQLFNQSYELLNRMPFNAKLTKYNESWDYRMKQNFFQYQSVYRLFNDSLNQFFPSIYKKY